MESGISMEIYHLGSKKLYKENFFIYKIDITYQTKHNIFIDFGTVYFNSRIFYGHEFRDCHEYGNTTVFQTKTLVAAPEEWLRINNYERENSIED